MSAQNVVDQSNLAQSTIVEARTTVKSHLLYIDNLRTALITFVILLHVAITYIAERDWYYSESGQASTVSFVIVMFAAAIGSAFVLGLFFMLADKSSRKNGSPLDDYCPSSFHSAVAGGL